MDITTRKRVWRINEARAQGWGDQAEAFVDWQDAMDKHVIQRLHISIHDLPDWDFAAAFAAHKTAQEAAEQFIKDQIADHGGMMPDDTLF